MAICAVLPLNHFELHVIWKCNEKFEKIAAAQQSSSVGSNTGGRNTGVGTIFTPGGQAAGPTLGRDASPSVREQVSHLQGGQSWQQWHGLPQTSCLLLCIFLPNKSIGCTGGELWTEMLTSILMMVKVGPRRRLVRRRKNLPPVPQQQVLTQPQPQLPQKLLATELSNESQHFKVACTQQDGKLYCLPFYLKLVQRECQCFIIIFLFFQGSPECYFVSQAETRLIRQKVKRKKRPSYIGAGGGKHDQASTNEVDSS